jgi:hypothetical protein
MRLPLQSKVNGQHIQQQRKGCHLPLDKGNATSRPYRQALHGD